MFRFQSYICLRLTSFFQLFAVLGNPKFCLFFLGGGEGVSSLEGPCSSTCSGRCACATHPNLFKMMWRRGFGGVGAPQFLRCVKSLHRKWVEITLECWFQRFFWIFVPPEKWPKWVLEFHFAHIFGQKMGCGKQKNKEPTVGIIHQRISPWFSGKCIQNTYIFFTFSEKKMPKENSSSHSHFGLKNHRDGFPHRHTWMSQEVKG